MRGITEGALHAAFVVVRGQIAQGGIVTPATLARALDIKPLDASNLIGELVRRGFCEWTPRGDGAQAGRGHA